MESGILAELLRQKRFAQCREQAGAVLRQPDAKPADKAFASFAMSCSLAALHAGQEALAPGELAVLLSRESREYDLLGQALCHLSTLCLDYRLYRRAMACLDEFFEHMGCYGASRRLEGKALVGLSQAYQAMGNGTKALEYSRKAYEWNRVESADPAEVERCRAAVTWQYLKCGQVDDANALLSESEAYLKVAAEDTQGIAGYRNNLAYRHYLTGQYSAAVAQALQVVQAGGISPEAKVRALITLHHAARSLRLFDVARGVGLLARIQANMANRPDLEDEAVASLVQMQGQDLPRVESLFRRLRQATDSRQENPQSQSNDA